jgi:hypothetical protein
MFFTLKGDLCFAQLVKHLHCKKVLMRSGLTILLIGLITLAACKSSDKEINSTSLNTMPPDGKEAAYPYVTAKINGKPWQSIKDEILATYSEFDDKLQIFTKDADGKMNFLLTLAPFSKTNVGDYNSVRQGAAGYGVSLLDEDTKDGMELDYDNFRQGAVANCLHITSIKEIAGGKIVEGSFTSPMNISNNYEPGKEKMEVTDGRFAVLIKK